MISDLRNKVNFYGGPQVSRQKKNARGKKEIGHGKRKIVAAKESNSQKKTKKYDKKSREKHLKNHLSFFFFPRKAVK